MISSWTSHGVLYCVNATVQLEALLAREVGIVPEGSSTGTVIQASCSALGFGDQKTRVSRNELPKPVKVLEEWISHTIQFKQVYCWSTEWRQMLDWCASLAQVRRFYGFEIHGAACTFLRGSRVSNANAIRSTGIGMFTQGGEGLEIDLPSRRAGSSEEDISVEIAIGFQSCILCEEVVGIEVITWGMDYGSSILVENRESIIEFNIASLVWCPGVHNLCILRPKGPVSIGAETLIVIGNGARVSRVIEIHKEWQIVGVFLNPCWVDASGRVGPVGISSKEDASQREFLAGD